MTPIVEAALLRYLAVAHFGRGRGQWTQGEAPPHWQPLVAQVLKARQADWQALWQGRSGRLDATGEAEHLQPGVAELVRISLRELLSQLYPAADSPARPAAPGAQSQP